MQYSTVHIVGEVPYFCCSHDTYHCCFCPVLWSSFDFFNTGTGEKMKVLPRQYVYFSPSEFPTTFAHDLPFARITSSLSGCRHAV
jgi:hypothetical protein